MKNIIFIIALFYPLLLFAQESSITEASGQDWIAFSDSYKAGYIQGYISSVVQTSEDARQIMEWINFDIRKKYSIDGNLNIKWNIGVFCIYNTARLMP